jgi:hypothetical protein
LAHYSPDNLQGASLAFAGLFLILTILGALTLAQLARLRAAWHESAQAMNVIKDFYIKHNKEIEPAFKWRAKTLPPTDKRFSIANLMAVEVTLLSAVTSAATVYFLLFYFGTLTDGTGRSPPPPCWAPILSNGNGTNICSWIINNEHAPQLRKQIPNRLSTPARIQTR